MTYRLKVTDGEGTVHTSSFLAPNAQTMLQAMAYCLETMHLNKLELREITVSRNAN